MISFRQILIIVLLIAGFWLFRRLRRRFDLNRRRRHPKQRPYEEMVRCAHCGTYLPQAQAVGDPRNGYFCNDKHRLARQPFKP